MKTNDDQLLADAKEAGFSIINGLIYCPAACDRMQSFRNLEIIISNRSREPLVCELERVARILIEVCK